MAFLTLDLFSTLVDSRTGGTAALDRIGGRRGWPVDAAAVYSVWDARNKESQKETVDWLPFGEHSRRALSVTYRELGLRGDPDVDAGRLLESMADWPLWADVRTALNRLRPAHRVGVLSNVDDGIFARTRVAPLVDPVDVLTSERLRAYKPHPAIYRRALQAGVEVHVPASARDTRGALEAGMRVVRVRRPGHSVDPDGPLPGLEIPDLLELGEAVATLVG